MYYSAILKAKNNDWYTCNDDRVFNISKNLISKLLKSDLGTFLIASRKKELF